MWFVSSPSSMSLNVLNYKNDVHGSLMENRLRSTQRILKGSSCLVNTRTIALQLSAMEIVVIRCHLGNDIKEFVHV